MNKINYLYNKMVAVLLGNIGSALVFPPFSSSEKCIVIGLTLLDKSYLADRKIGHKSGYWKCGDDVRKKRKVKRS